MRFYPKKIFLYLSLSLSFSLSIRSQDLQDNYEIDSSYIPPTDKSFHAGVYIGTFWANHYTAYLYDGYGFDQNGQRNSFNNSILYNQIVNIYGGANGGNDLIAQLLNVDHKDWNFTEKDMPTNLRYSISYLVGLNLRYQLHKKASILLNFNGTKLSVNGKFTISSTSPNTGFSNPYQNATKLNQFTIVGAEQRLNFQFGYQRVLGNHEKLNFMVESGMNIIFSKAQKNQAFLTSDINGGQNNISFDLMSIYNQAPYNYYSAKYLIGVGIGAFASFGLNLTINPRYTIQLLYSPSYDRISLGYNPKFSLQHGLGLRIYYNAS